MGKRRVRNLIALNHKDIAGFDVRQDRVKFAAHEYGVQTFSDFDQAVEEFGPDLFIISTPPDLHMRYAYYALKKKIHCFIEGSVVEANKILELGEKARDLGVIMVPSCTMRFYPGPIQIKDLVRRDIVGRPLNYNYQSGQYLPDWHPWESVEDFYVSNPDTGGCREIVPFELTWLNDIFGNPTPVACVKRKLSDMNIEIDDLYHCLLEYPGGLVGNLTVEVLSRPESTREFRLIGSEGEIVYSGGNNTVRYINTSMSSWKVIKLNTGTVEKQYINPEEPYIEEIRKFIEAVTNKDPGMYPNTLYDDYLVLNNLYDLEALS